MNEAEREPPNFDMAYWVVPGDGIGPAFGPVVSRGRATREAQWRRGYVIGVEVMYLADCTGEPVDSWPSHDR